MPTATFFRLPEEKRTRLIKACWGELTRVRFTDVSINRIIAAARIPRGSFYQYFEDKEDPIRYLLEDMRQYFITQLRDILVEAKGDLFALPLMAYDRFIGRQGHTDPMLTLFIQLITMNKGPLWEVVDPSRLRRNEREYADQVFHLACAVLAFAIVETLHCRIPSDRVRELIRLRMDLLRCGGASDSYKEENT